MKNELGLELKIADVKITQGTCIVSKCNETATGLTIASRYDDEKLDVRNFPGCAKHDGGVYKAVSIGFGEIRDIILLTIQRF